MSRLAFEIVRDDAGGLAETVSPGAQRLVAQRDGAAVAHVASWRVFGLTGAPGWTGVLGHYRATDAEAGVALLREAARRLAHAGVRRVLGPMDGSTWHRYRVALANGSTAPPFLGEPSNPPEHAEHFRLAGFGEVARYESRIAQDLSVGSPSAQQARARVRDHIRIEPLRLERFDTELEEIHALSQIAFAGNLYFSPLPLEEFRALYLPMRERLDPELALLARQGRRLVGFAFAYPDAAPGGEGRVILKTLACAPEASGQGLGGLLVDEVRRVALEKGRAAVVHALIHLANRSRRISAHTTTHLRSYALYEWTPS